MPNISQMVGQKVGRLLQCTTMRWAIQPPWTNGFRDWSELATDLWLNSPRKRSPAQSLDFVISRCLRVSIKRLISVVES